MFSLPPKFQDHIRTGTTCLCFCWLIRCHNGQTFGYTDHDTPITINGITYDPYTGFTASAAISDLGLSIGGAELMGALRADKISESDIAAGLLDNAEIEMFQVNWQDPSSYIRLRKDTIGDITQEDGLFKIELRGPAAKLDHIQGRLYQYDCDANVGDHRCKLDLTNPSYRAEAAIIAIEGKQHIRIQLTDDYKQGWFSLGVMTWLNGIHKSHAHDINAHEIIEQDDQIYHQFTLWRPHLNLGQPGDRVRVTVGCDKLKSTCQSKFSNLKNFRGFPSMPGNDEIFSSS